MDDALLDLIEHLAQTVYDLRAPRCRVSRRLRDRVGDRDGWVCRICEQPVDRDRPWIHPVAGEPFARGSNNAYPSVEHVVSVGAGGTNNEANLAICHLGCNSNGHLGGRPAENRAEIRRATAAANVLNAVGRVRREGFDQADDALIGYDLKLLVRYFKDVGRAAETLRVRRYVREREHRRPEGPPAPSAAWLREHGSP